MGVIKFPLSGNLDEQCPNKKDILYDRQKQEGKNRQLLWNVITRTVKLGGEKALLMPFVHMLNERQQTSCKIIEMVKKTIENIANKGYCHENLKWSHIGYLKIKNGRGARMVFIDLHRNSKRDSDDAKKAMHQSMG
jgi:hypothetical protein